MMTSYGFIIILCDLQWRITPSALSGTDGFAEAMYNRNRFVTEQHDYRTSEQLCFMVLVHRAGVFWKICLENQ